MRRGPKIMIDVIRAEALYAEIGNWTRVGEVLAKEQGRRSAYRAASLRNARERADARAIAEASHKETKR